MALDAVSTNVYTEKISPFLPKKIIDIHVHLGLPEFISPISKERLSLMWALEVANSFSWEELNKWFAALFPDKEMLGLVFGFPFQESDIERGNTYVLDGLKKYTGTFFGLLVTKPEDEAGRLDKAMQQGFLGIKPYPDFAPGGYGDVSIFDFLPHEHLNVLNQHKAILMLHIPRKDRLADPDNIREILQIHEKYPDIKFIVAHIGRAYCLPTAERGLPQLAQAPGLYYDFAANLNADVLEYAIDLVGADKILYGSDLPVALMKGIREHVGEKYYNFTSGDYSWNTDRKPAEIEAKYTYFIYEQLLALIKAAENFENSEEVIEKIVYTNSARLLGL